MKTNRFKSESKNDDEEIIDLNKLTKDQNIKLTNFFIKLLNSARTQLGLKEIYADPKNQKLANDIAAIYLRDRKFGLVTDTEPTGHYVKGIVEAAHDNGLNIDNNYIEDLSMNLQTAGPSDIYKEKTSMTQAKQFIYDGIVGMLFGGTTGNDGTIMEGTEYHHARSLLYPTNITGAVSFHYGVPEDGIGAGYGEVVTHFILIPDFAIQVSDSNKGTYKPTSQN